jgi:hypothetical protein
MLGDISKLSKSQRGSTRRTSPMPAAPNSTDRAARQTQPKRTSTRFEAAMKENGYSRALRAVAWASSP